MSSEENESRQDVGRGGNLIAAGGTEESGRDADNIPLFDASKMGFNDRAWNDPPPLLMNTGAPSARSKLTSRVPFPMNSSQQTSSSPPTNLNPNAPPPLTGFVKSLDSSNKSLSTDSGKSE